MFLFFPVIQTVLVCASPSSSYGRPFSPSAKAGCPLRAETLPSVPVSSGHCKVLCTTYGPIQIITNSGNKALSFHLPPSTAHSDTSPWKGKPVAAQTWEVIFQVGIFFGRTHLASFPAGCIPEVSKYRNSNWLGVSWAQGRPGFKTKKIVNSKKQTMAGVHHTGGETVWKSRATITISPVTVYPAGGNGRDSSRKVSSNGRQSTTR